MALAGRERARLGVRVVGGDDLALPRPRRCGRTCRLRTTQRKAGRTRSSSAATSSGNAMPERASAPALPARSSAGVWHHEPGLRAAPGALADEGQAHLLAPELAQDLESPAGELFQIDWPFLLKLPAPPKNAASDFVSPRSVRRLSTSSDRTTKIRDLEQDVIGRCDNPVLNVTERGGEGDPERATYLLLPPIVVHDDLVVGLKERDILS